MDNITRHTGTLTILERLPSSQFGNPRYLLMVDGYVFRTCVDSMHAYGITNYEGKPVIVTVGTHYGKLTLNTINSVEGN